MKTKLIIVLAVVLSVVAGGSAGALVYHIQDAKEAVISEEKTRVDTFISEMDQMIKNDTSDLTQKEIGRIREEAKRHTNEKLGGVYQNRLNEKSAEIKKESDKTILEINKIIDEYISDHKGM